MKYFRLDRGVDAVWNVGTWLRKHVGRKGQYRLLTNYSVRTTCRGQGSRAGRSLRQWFASPVLWLTSRKGYKHHSSDVDNYDHRKAANALATWEAVGDDGMSQTKDDLRVAVGLTILLPVLTHNQLWRHWLKFVERSRWGNDEHSC